MLIVEIHRNGTPVIYRSDKPRKLIRQKDRAKCYKFACVAQMMQRFKLYDYDFEDQIRMALEVFPEPPQVYHVQVFRLRRIVRKVLRFSSPQETPEREEKCLNPSTEFNYSVTSDETPK